MTDIYEFIERCKEDGLSSREAESQWAEFLEEKHNAFMENYYSDPYVVEGLAQQDLIDTYRFER